MTAVFIVQFLFLSFAKGQDSIKQCKDHFFKDEFASAKECFLGIPDNGEAFYFLGLIARKFDGDDEKALLLFARADEMDFPAASANLGYMHQYGIGTSKNEEQAKALYRRSLRLDSSQINTHLLLGILCQRPSDRFPDYKCAEDSYQQAADLGSIEAKYNLSLLFERLNRKEEAFRLSKEAADAGLPQAQFNVASLFRIGIGVVGNLDEAKRYYTLAAEQGYVLAQFSLGLYFLAEEIPPDRIEAYKWLRVAEANGYREASAQLEIARRFMTEEEREEAERLAKEILAQRY